MSETTFITEWDWENLSSMVIAERTLRQKAKDLREIMYELALEQEERRRQA